MDTKVLAGFLAGTFFASGVAYIISHRHTVTAPEVPTVAAAPPAPIVETPAPPLPAHAPMKKQMRKRIAADAAPPVQPEPEPPKPREIASVAPLATPEPAPEPVSAPPPPPPAVETRPEPRQSRTVTLIEGILIPVRLSEGLSSQRNQAGDAFTATLDQPLEADGLVIAERGARVEGRVTQAQEAGRVRGLSKLTVELTKISTSDGQRIAIRTASFVKTGPESKGEDAAKVGIGAALGAIIGAAAGGGKGAAIGAAAGGAAGTGTVIATRGKPAELRVETRISFRLEQPVTITEQLGR